MTAETMVAYRGFRIEYDRTLACWWVIEPESGEAWGFAERLDAARNIADGILAERSDR